MHSITENLSWKEVREQLVAWLENNSHTMFVHDYYVNRYCLQLAKPVKIHTMCIGIWKEKQGEMRKLSEQDQKAVKQGFKRCSKIIKSKERILKRFDRIRMAVYSGPYTVRVFLDIGFNVEAPIPEEDQMPEPVSRIQHRTIREAEAEYRKLLRKEEEDRNYVKTLVAAQQKGESAPVPVKKRRRVDWSDLKQLHEKFGGDTAAIAEIKECSDAAVQRMYRINNWRIKSKSSTGRRGREPQYDWSQLEALRDEHEGNTEEIARVIGCSVGAVDRRFKQNDWEIKKPKVNQPRGGRTKRSYSSEEETIIRRCIREGKKEPEIVAELAAAGYTRSEHAITYAVTRKFADERKFAGKLKVTNKGTPKVTGKEG